MSTDKTVELRDAIRIAFPQLTAHEIEEHIEQLRAANERHGGA